MAFTMEQRAYDHLYDPVWTSPGHDNSAGTTKHTDVSGSFRFRYCEKPLVSAAVERQHGPEIIFAATPQTAGETGELKNNSANRGNEAATRTVGCQTVYRDSEAQTDPYTPEYFVKQPKGGEEKPEIVYLSHLSFGNGLPVSDKEINRIERDRERREKGKALPPITDTATLEMHRKFLEDQERQDFKLREDEIDEEMTKRLEDFRRSLSDKNAENEFLMEQRVETFRRKKINDRNAELGKIQKRRTHSLRKQTSEANNHNKENWKQNRCSSLISAEKSLNEKIESCIGVTTEDFLMLENDTLNALVRVSNMSGDDREKIHLAAAADRKQAALEKDLQLISKQLDSQDQLNCSL